MGVLMPNSSYVRTKAVVFLFLLVITVASSTSVAADSSSAPPTLALKMLVAGLTNPLDFATAKDGTGRLFVVEQGGTIRIIQRRALLPGPFLNITNLVESSGEEGLLGLAFHPLYKTNGRFFVNYTRRVNGQLQTVIAEYHVSSTDPNKADPRRKKILIIDQPFDNHNGGQLAFGPDKFLYIALGDGGSEGDPLGNGQNLGTLLGKVLRINVDSGTPYVILPDNPFVGNPSARGEIWAYGLRNPWRFSFDRGGTHRLFAGDVGQDNYEEVDIIRRGRNYGWNIMEGFHCYPPPTANCDMMGLTTPIAEYSHSLGEAVIGGYVYRGSAMPALQGVYVFGDYLSGKVWGLREVLPGTWQRVLLLSSGKIISAFGQDASGELYLLDYTNGIVYSLVQAA